MAKVAIMGYGTVGSGVYDIIKTNSASSAAVRMVKVWI